MEPYETMLLVDPRRTDAEIDETVTLFTTLVTDRGGEVTNWDRWGRRKLAYEINDLTEGYYAICDYTVDASARAEIEAALPFVEGLMRTKTVRKDLRTRGV